MTYLINLSLTLLIFFSNLSFANDNKIIFEINNNIYSTLDFKYRVNYLEEINRIKYSPNLEKDLKNDFFNSVIFFEYVINNNKLNSILETESKRIFTQIINQFKLIDILKEEVIINNKTYLTMITFHPAYLLRQYRSGNRKSGPRSSGHLSRFRGNGRKCSISGGRSSHQHGICH